MQTVAIAIGTIPSIRHRFILFLSTLGRIAEYRHFKVGGAILQEAAVPQKSKLLDTVRQTLRLRQYSYRMEQSAA